MNNNIYIEPETMRKAEENTRKALKMPLISLKKERPTKSAPPLLI